MADGRHLKLICISVIIELCMQIGIAMTTRDPESKL